MVVQHLVSHVVVDGIIRFFLPSGANPRWYHVLAIVASCTLMFAGLLGALFDFMTGKYLLGLVALGMFAAGYGWALAIRRTFRPADVRL